MMLMIEPRRARVSGNPHDIDHWPRRYADCPVVKLNGEIVAHVVEALESANGDMGYVRFELRTEADELQMAWVILPTGEVLDRQIAEKTVCGKVEIIGERLAL